MVCLFTCALWPYMCLLTLRCLVSCCRIRNFPTCAIGHKPKVDDNGEWVATGNPVDPYQCVPDDNFVVSRAAYGGHDHLESFEDPNSAIGAGWYLVRRTHTAQWHQATDALSGTAVYGSFDSGGPDGPGTARKTFSIPFINYDYDQFLFASGDLSMWMIMDKGSIMDCQSIKSSAIDLPWNPVIRHSNFEEDCNRQNNDQAGCEGVPYCEWVPNHAQDFQQCVGVSCNQDDRTANCALKASDHSWNGMIAAQQYCRATCCPEDPVRPNTNCFWTVSVYTLTGSNLTGLLAVELLDHADHQRFRSPEGGVLLRGGYERESLRLGARSNELVCSHLILP